MAPKASQVIKYLGDDLQMRRSTRQDAERLAEFNCRIHGEDPYDGASVAAWTLDLLAKPHPAFNEGDFVIVENARTSEIVSCTCLISQTWSYDGIPFGVGRPELVGTDPQYRARGLVRAEFDTIHQWSRDRGELVQVITGIPFFYRQFGYEMGLDLGGGRFGYSPVVPRLPDGQEEPFLVRPAAETDLPFLMRMLDRERSRSMFSAVWDESLLRFELSGKIREDVNRLELRIIESRDGRPLGYLGHQAFTWWGSWCGLVAQRYELDEGVSFLAVTPSVLRYLWEAGQVYAPERGRVANAVGLWLGSEHPAYQATAGRLEIERKPYAYYVRVPDLPAFLRQIAPALEHHLKGSACEGHTGELKISFYRDGIRLALEQGRLAAIETWNPRKDGGEPSASFPDLTFLQLVFGYRSIGELRHAWADCSASSEARVLLEALFPKRYSYPWAIS